MKEKGFFKYIVDENVLIAGIIIFLVFYILTKHPIFAILSASSLILGFILESYYGVKKHGIKREAVETLLAIFIVLLFWFSLQYLLSTSTPISAVVSCSMLPNIARGDLVLIKGQVHYNGPVIHVKQIDINRLASPYADVFYNGEYLTEIKGSIFSYCLISSDGWCKDFFVNPKNFTEKKGNFEFFYKQCERVNIYNKKQQNEPCIYKIKYKDKELNITKKGDVIIYKPNVFDLFNKIGDIIHRVVLVIKTDNDTYYLTKGDNNNVLDIMFYSYKYDIANTPVEQKRVLGKVILRIPFIGYLRVFLSPYIEEQQQCATNLIY